MRKSFILAAATALLAGAPAAAQPVISGTYLVTQTVTCQPTTAVNYAGTDVGLVVNNVTQTITTNQLTMLLVTFNATKMSATYSGFGASGSVNLLQSTGQVQANSGVATGQAPGSGKTSYANTDTTLTFNGRTLQAFYGQLDKKNIAHYITAQGTYAGENGSGCMEQDIASRQ
jgi:hypothetical protein